MASACSDSDLVVYRRVFVMAIVLGLGGSFLSGFQLSTISFAAPFIKQFINDTWLQRTQAPIEAQSLTLLWTLIVSALSIGALTGTWLSGCLSAKYGKKNCLIVSSLVMIAASGITGMSKLALSFEMILLGRILYGFNAGFGCCLQGQYLGEIAPNHLRGLITGTLGIFAVLGKFLGQVAGQSELLGTESLWPLLLASSGVIGLVQLLIVPFFPESPAFFLFQKKDLDGCLKALKQLWGDRDHQAEVEDMLKEQAAMKKTRIMSVLELVRDRSLRRQLSMMMVLGVAMSLSGVNAIYFYSFEVFRTAGFDKEHIPYAALGVGACELCAIVACTFTIERFGRRKLLLGGYGLMVLVLAILTTTLSLQESYFVLPYCNVALLFLFILIFGSGPAAATFPVTAELFTQGSRPASLTISMSLYWTGLYLIGMGFPHVVNQLGTFCFLVFGAIIATAWILIFWFLPETKGKSYMEIKGEFNRSSVLKKGNVTAENSLPEELTVCTKL